MISPPASATASVTSSTASTSEVRRSLLAAVPALLTLLALLAGTAVPTYGGQSWTLPPGGVDWDYQLGGARPVPAHVAIVERDRHASPVAG